MYNTFSYITYTVTIDIILIKCSLINNYKYITQALLLSAVYSIHIYNSIYIYNS